MTHQFLLTTQDFNKCTEMKKINRKQLYFCAIGLTTITPVVCIANDRMMELIKENDISFLDENLHRIKTRIKTQIDNNQFTVEEVWTKNGGSLYVIPNNIIGIFRPEETKIITNTTELLGKQWFISSVGTRPAIMIY